MLDTTHIFDERAATYPPGTDFWSILTDEMNSLYQLSFLLTADLDKARQCFVSWMGESDEEVGVFIEWARAWARRMIIKNAIWMIMPELEHADNSSFAHINGSAKPRKPSLFDAIIRLNPFERFVYVMSVLEKHSDDDCSILLRCSRRDIMIGRALALKRLANTFNTADQPLETVGGWRTMFANHCA